jgi:hypothetical protein
MGLWWADVIREGQIFNKDVLSINLTVCWKLLRAFGPLSYLAARNNPNGLDNQQETNGDLSSIPLVGSSETICQALVDLGILNPIMKGILIK